MVNDDLTFIDYSKNFVVKGTINSKSIKVAVNNTVITTKMSDIIERMSDEQLNDLFREISKELKSRDN